MTHDQQKTSVPLLRIFGARQNGRSTGQIHARELAVLKTEKEKQENRKAKFRLRVAIAGAAIVYAAIGMKMTALALSEPLETPNGYVGQNIYGGRADIVDRNGEILATNLPGYSLYVHPYNIVDAEAAARGLVNIFPKMNEERNLKLSLDLAVQDALESELYKGIVAYNAKAGTSIVMEADTGRIVAMASLPDFDPNLRPKEIDETQDAANDPRFNRAALGTYELGSTFKIFTVAEVLEKGIANPNTIIKVGYSIKAGKYEIKDFKFYGNELSLTDIIVKSSNVGTARLARGMGTEVQQEFLGKLGMLKPTSLELPEAKNAQPQIPARWTELSTMTVSYGHGISVTPVHLAAGYAAMVNGGFKVEPTLLQNLPEDRHAERVISAKTSMQVREMMRQVVRRGTASYAKTDGYDIGGKTGTADKLNGRGGYYENRNINTFAGAFPMSDPKYVIVTVLDEPNVADTKKRTAGWTVVPLTRGIVERVAPLLNVRPVYTPDLPMVAKVKNEVNVDG